MLRSQSRIPISPRFSKFRRLPRPAGLCVTDTEEAHLPLILDTETLSTCTHLCAHTYSFAFLSLSDGDKSFQSPRYRAQSDPEGAQRPLQYGIAMREGSCHIPTVHRQGTGALGQQPHFLTCHTERPLSHCQCCTCRGVQPDPLVPVPGPVSTRTESDVSWRWAAAGGWGDLSHSLFSGEVAGPQSHWQHFKDGEEQTPTHEVRRAPAVAGVAWEGQAKPCSRHPRTWRGRGPREEARGRGGPVRGQAWCSGTNAVPLCEPRLCEEVPSHQGGTRGRSLSQGAIR